MFGNSVISEECRTKAQEILRCTKLDKPETRPCRRLQLEKYVSTTLNFILKRRDHRRKRR
jgi:hypothetical protein